MRYTRSVIALASACAITLAAASCSASGSHAAGQADDPVAAMTGTSYYLSLGDSLAQGVQPASHGYSLPTSEGYPNRLYAVLRQDRPGLRLVKLGCSGETTRTMMQGGICRYPGGSQLAAAERFLRAHRGQVALITLDIGANDPNSCFISTTAMSKIATCMDASITRTQTDLREILAGLRAAGGRDVPVIGMNYYVPELAGWFYGKAGQEVAVLSERLVAGFNRLLEGVYRHYGARVANVFSAFHSSDFTDRVRLKGQGVLPRNVATVCAWTWACADGSTGPNEHPNDTGYGIIALAFLLADPGMAG